jgi:integrase
VSADAWLFPNDAGTFLSVTNWKRRAFDTAAARAKLTPPSLRVHDLRHTAASLSIASGVSVNAVQRQLGHRGATLTLDRYGHLWPDELDALADALERLRSAVPADSSRTVEMVADVVALESRR